MSILDIIAKKRDKEILTKEEIEFFIKEYTAGNITDYQAAALIMAIYINGMNDQEITDLTVAMAYSGEILDLSELGENIVDKHSTGGIGDKITLILMPVIASLGIQVAKMSGRGLGFTGGTADKLESIPGYNININVQEFIENVQDIGISLMSQTLDLAPADKKIYALRDTISCVDNIPLIASSIMSKKIASGADKIVIDVTVGSGAFMKRESEARKLADKMIKIGKLAGKEVVCVLTEMNQPTGYSVGNTLEVIEAVEALKGKMQEDIKQIVLALGAQIIKLAGKGDNIEENKLKILENLNNNKAFDKFIELVENQGGDTSYIKNIEKFKTAEYIIPVISDKRGFVKKMNAEEIGKISCELGAGRIKKDDSIDHQVGIIIMKKIGDRIEEGDTLGFIHANTLEKRNSFVERLKNCYEFTDKYPIKPKPVLGIME